MGIIKYSLLKYKLNNLNLLNHVSAISVTSENI